jgi:calcium/calmodulin-dependent protein kinase I
MSCFTIFCRDPTTADRHTHFKKYGAFLPSRCDEDDDDGESRTRASSSATSNGTLASSSSSLPKIHKGRIPWVWSRKFHDTYQLGPKLGAGAFSVVHEATQKEAPHTSYAVKIIERARLSRKQLIGFKNEVQILADLQHPNIIYFHELYKAPQYFFVVLEKLQGGELFDRLCEKHSYTELEARNVCKTIFQAMAYCHAQGVAHRDLKPENLLLKDSWNDAQLKIADFGFAKRVERPNSLTTRCGSPAYTAPEIINYQPYDQRADNWSLGVILFTILGGYPPFYENTVHETFQQIRQCNYQFHPSFWDGISRDAKHLIKALLTLNPEWRCTAQEALQHPWMTGRGTADDELKQSKPLKMNLEQFKKYNAERKRETKVSNVSMYWLLTRR